jgi:hypothetical protein
MNTHAWSETYGRRVVMDRAGKSCELCHGPGPLQWAHRRNRSHGGTWAPSNGLHLCDACHRWTEKEAAKAAAGGWRIVHDDTDPLLVPVWLQSGPNPPGWWLLDDLGVLHYPTLVGSQVAPFGLPDLPGWVTP